MYDKYVLSRIHCYCLICLCLLGGSACWGGKDGNGKQPEVVQFQVDMYDTYYGPSDTNLANPPVWSVPSGADVVVTIVNLGKFDHNWAVVKKGITIPVPYQEGQGGDIILHGVGMVYNNSQTTITFSAPEPGEYQVICTVSGHYPNMQGKFVVTE